MNEKQLVLILFILTVNLINLISSTVSMPSFNKWKKSARSDSTSRLLTTSYFDNQQKIPIKFIDVSFLQSLPNFVFGPLKRSQKQQTEFVNLNSLERPINQFDSYLSYETMPSETLPTSTNFKSSINKPMIKNELDNSNEIHSKNEPYQDDDVIVIPFTKHRGTAKFGDSDDNVFSGKTEQGVPGAIGYDPTKEKIINPSKKASPSIDLNKFKSKIITDSEDDLDTGDDLPSSLSAGDETSDFKVQFSNLHPVYVLPPAEFKPVFYPNREIDGIKLPINKRDDGVTIKPLVTDEKQEQPYKYINGLSSWILGGDRSLSRGSYWEQLANDEALYGYGKIKLNDDKKANDKIESNQNNFKLKPTFDLISESTSIKNLNNNHDNLEFISLTEPKGRSDEELELKKIKLNRKPHLISKFKKTNFMDKNKLIKRKFSLNPKKLNKFLIKANKP